MIIYQARSIKQYDAISCIMGIGVACVFEAWRIQGTKGQDISAFAPHTFTILFFSWGFPNFMEVQIVVPL